MEILNLLLAFLPGRNEKKQWNKRLGDISIQIKENMGNNEKLSKMADEIFNKYRK